MKNADIPAMPCTRLETVQTSKHFQEFGAPRELSTEVSYSGLTKREIFALHAPEVPESFKKDWEKSNNENSEFFALVDAYCEFGNIDYQDREITIKGQMALMKSWRYAYADMMTSED